MIWLWLACTGAASSLEDCAGLKTADERVVCRAGFLVEAPLEEQLALLDTLDDPLEHDKLLVELAVGKPVNGGRLCARAQSEYGERQCLQVIGRPHLGQERKGGKGKAP